MFRNDRAETKKTRVLIVTHVKGIWSAKASGATNAIKSLIDYLDLQYDLEVYCTRYVPLARRVGLKLYSGQSLPRYISESLVSWLSSIIFSSEPRRPILLRDGNRKARREREVFRRFLRGRSYDVVIFEYLHNHHLLEECPDSSKRIIDTLDIMHLRYNSFEQHGVGFNYSDTIEEAEELSCLSKYDRLVAIQESEGDYLEEKLPGRVIVAKRPAYICEAIEMDYLSERLVVVFVASNAAHNLDAIEWFYNEIWEAELNNYITVRICGSVCQDLKFLDLDGKHGVDLVQSFSDINDAYKGSHLAINPVRIGSGLKIKNIEALGFGRPVLTTALGGEGFEACAESVFIFRDQFQFKETVMEFHRNRNKLRIASEKAISDAKEYFSPKAVFGALCDYIEN